MTKKQQEIIQKIVKGHKNIGVEVFMDREYLVIEFPDGKQSLLLDGKSDDEIASGCRSMMRKANG